MAEQNQTDERWRELAELLGLPDGSAPPPSPPVKVEKPPPPAPRADWAAEGAEAPGRA